MFSITTFLALSLPLVSAWRNPLSTVNQEKRASDPSAFPFLCNCWTNPTDGTRSEVDFYSSYPTNFGNATPEYSSIIQENVNLVWENGGSTKGPNGGTFTWSTLTKNAATNSQAGTATDGNNKYIILRDTDSTLYTQTLDSVEYNCIVVYRAQLDSASEPTSPSTNATSAPTSTSSSSPTSAGSSQTASPSTGASSGLSTDAKIGLGVGIGIGIPLLAGIIVAAIFFSRLRRRRNQREPMGIASNEKKFYPDSGQYQSAPYGPTNGFAAPGKGPLGSQHLVSELHHDAARAEMPSDRQIVEAGPGRYERVPNSPVELDVGGRI